PPLNPNDQFRPKEIDRARKLACIRQARQRPYGVLRVQRARGKPMIRSTMQRVPLSLNQVLERAGKFYPRSQIVSRLPDKSLRRDSFADFYARARRLAAALFKLGLKKGDRVATLSWNHYAHLECYFGIPAAGGVMHTLNLRLAPDEIAFIANHAKDRF